MARAYTLGTVAFAFNVDKKWLDNTLSHYRVHGVHQKRQGIARRLTIESLLTLSVAIVLTDHLEVPLGRAIVIAQNLGAGGGQYLADDTLELRVDLQTVHAHLLERLE